MNQTQKNTSENHTNSRAKKAKNIIVVLLFFIVAAAGIIFNLYVQKQHNDTHTKIGGKEYNINKKVLVFSSSDIDTIDGMKRFTNPKSIDLRGSGVSSDETVELLEIFPDCDIRWYVPVASSTDSHAEEIKLSSTDKDSISMLSLLPKLKYIDARGLDFEAVQNIMTLRPDCSLDWDLKVGDARYPHNAEVISITDASPEEVENLIHLKNLKKVNALGSSVNESLVELTSKMPDCEFWWSGEIFGIELDNSVTSLNFKRKKVKDIDALDKEFEEKLKYFPNLKTIDMCGCGVASTQMAKWRDKYTDVKFVWEITFGRKGKEWTVRTDIQVFSSLIGDGRHEPGTQKTFKDLFLYCTDLVAVDLGHNNISDISQITNLQKLQGLILMDNPVTDFSPLGELPNIQFLELNATAISDLSVFQKCKNLKHLDVHYTKVRDLKPLYKCESLEYVILASNKISSEQRNAFKSKLPNCKKAYTVKNNDHYIRNNPIRSSFRLAFKNYDLVEDFVSWDNVTYKKGAKLKYPKGYIKY